MGHDRRMLNAEVLRLIQEQDGVVSRVQLRFAGLSASTIRRMVRAGVWEARGRSALLVPNAAESLAVRTRVLAINHPSLLATGASAIALDPKSPLRRFIDDADQPWMIGPRSKQWFGIAHPDAVTKECGPLLIAATTTALVDLIRFLPRKRARDAAMTAVQRKVITVRRLRRAAHDLVGYPGSGQLREVIRALSEGAQSGGEHRLLRMLRSRGLRRWVANYPIVIGGRRIVIDVAFPEHRVAVEFDGWAFHSDAESFQRDRERQNLLVNASWLVLRFTWADLDDPAAVVAQIEEALRARAAWSI